MKSIQAKHCLLIFAVLLNYLRTVESLSCHKCGTLSSSARYVEDCTGASTVEDCAPNEVCVVFKRLYKKGSSSIRGCFDKSQSLPGIKDLDASSECKFVPEKRSSVKACMCNSDLCNDKEYDLHKQRANRLFRNQTGSSPSAIKNRKRAKVTKEDDKEDTTTSRNQGVVGSEEDGELFFENDEDYYGEEPEIIDEETQEEIEEERDYDEALYDDFLHHAQNISNQTNMEARVPRQSNVGATPNFNFNQHGRIDCKWSDFSSWSDCSQSCNGGVQFRERKILILARQGGSPCRGERKESRVCSTQQCPPDFVGDVPDVNCPLVNVIGATYANCDGRYKVTNNKVPWASERPVYKHTRKNRYIFWNAGGLGWSIGKREYLKTGSHWHRSGLDTDEPWEGKWEEGVRVECVGGSKKSPSSASTSDDTGSVDCLWSSYGQWSRCSVSCGTGTQQRKRMILQPSTNGGKSCRGDAIESRQCNAGATCPVNCEWSNFGQWSSCSATCGGGRQTRRRNIRRRASGSGRPCLGEKAETRSCSTNPCSISCGWSDFTPWSVCSATCGPATQRRFRTVIQQPQAMSHNNDHNDNHTPTTTPEPSTTTPTPTLSPNDILASTRNMSFADLLFQGFGAKTESRHSSSNSDIDNSISSSFSTIPTSSPLYTTLFPSSTTTTTTITTTTTTTSTTTTTPTSTTTTSTTTTTTTTNTPIDNEVNAALKDQPIPDDDLSTTNNSNQCCERVIVKANGNAKLDQSLYLGAYNKISDSYNGRFAYEREGREQLYIYFFKSQADSLNLWVIGPELGQFIAGIRNDGQETCIHKTAQEWKYASRAGVWKDDDPTLAVECFNGETTTTTNSNFGNRVNCEWSQYGEWSPCSKSCGRGIQFRTRRVAVTPKNGGSNCVGSNKDTRSCNVKSCNFFTTTNRPPTTTTRRPVVKAKPIDPNRRVKCFACGSLFSTDAPECDKFDVSASQQQTTCARGEACLWYSYHKSAGDIAIIRECFSTSILLGSIENPIAPSHECVPRPVENDDSIMACICATDFCNGYDGGSPVNLKTTTTPTPLRLPQSQTERPRSQVGRPQAPSPNDINRNTLRQSGGKVLCHQCGSLFSGSGNPPCEEGNVFSKSILLGSIDKPLQLRRECVPQDISETRASNIYACLCDTERCNANGERSVESDKIGMITIAKNNQQTSRRPTTTRRPSFTQTTPSSQFRSPSTPPPRSQNTFSGGPGLQCYSCGSLLNTDAKCDKFNPTDPTQIQTCKEGEACLLYKWKKSSVETAILRECFSKNVLLGSFDSPLLPTTGCNIRDISEPQSSSIEACLCTTDFCNDDLGRSPGGDATSQIQERQTTRSRFTDTTNSPTRSRFSETTKSSNFFERTTKASTFFDQKSRASTPGFRPDFNDLPDKFEFNRNDNLRKTSCPRGYTLTPTGCYQISDRRMGWIEAKKLCESENGNLLAIDNEEERQAILELISESSPRTRFEFWLGGNDIEIENRWVWTGFGNTILVPDFGWLDRPVPSVEENCLTWSITLARKGSRRRSSEGWHSDSCCNAIKYICELK
ncbi:unnamed protein product [Lepeophtheirus salmonis]|uniref:(salmon louse) hypothetical protein n=1 Tax=Lepeophtheirus salmonis TaxID=72036 RepID=A0A7R8CWM1_LEPSM|nr:unnamed protein product [Lepeophtheirus salmonis]CAF2904675.1 unnamed protein product [Lepeophtheirus salmonis]